MSNAKTEASHQKLMVPAPPKPGRKRWVRSIRKHWQKLVALALWAVLLVGYYWYARQNNLTPLAAVQALVELMQSSIYGPLIYLVIYALRPLIFFSAILLTVAGGYIFGPFWGIIYTIIAANTSAMVAYLIGRYFGQGLLDSDSEGMMQRYATRMRVSSFETVLVMRFVFLPYDLVNYMGGLLRIDWKAFLLATALGSIPGTTAFVLFGASIEGDFDSGLPNLNPWVLAGSGIIFITSLLLSRYFKRRERGAE